MSTRIPILVLVAAHLGFPCTGSADEPVKTVADLKWDVELRERELAAGQCELARARGRLALAQRNRALAAAELHKVVTYYEQEVKWRGDVLDNYFKKWPRGCFPDTSQFRSAKKELRNARIELALAEGNLTFATGELREAVTEQEERVQVIRILLDKRLANAEELTEPEAELAKLRKRLKAVEKELKKAKTQR